MLIRVQDALATFRWVIARLTRDAMYEVELHSSDAVSAVRYALNALRAEIQHQRRQAEDGHRKSVS